MNAPHEECPHGLARGTCSICSGLEERRKRDVHRTSDCQACGEAIMWCVSERGKKISIDAEPSSDGRFAKVRVEPNGDRIVHFVRDDELADNRAPLYTCHFDTCSARKKKDDQG